MPTTDIPPPGRAAGTASRCGPLPRALRLLREAKERPRSPSVRESRAGASELRRWSRPPAPRRLRPGPPPPRHCGSPPPTGSYCALRLRARPREARATGRLRLGGLALGRSRQRSATARCAAPGSRRNWERGRPRSRGEGRGGRSRDARRGQVVSGQLGKGGRGRGGGQWTPLSGAPLSARPPASPQRRNPQHRPPAPILPRSPRAAACSLTCRPRRPEGPMCGSPRGASGSLSVRWSPLCGAPATPASQPPRCARPWPLTLSALAMKTLLLGVDPLPSELQKRGCRGPRAACALGQVLHLRRLLLSLHIPARTPFFLL